ncbi:ABC transporter permease [Pseudonocardia abyssalis]|uniref:ABC transporter permease subunit n=1 Tax=Pseudonocardia abyssalis TaxID=2792008 RepID=A0ABS6UN43_9PSEU|nr:ABC transporter permease subunit [Pseudonocardia abyssalis]MBW0116750.1 ABC transporter permease subunit [Pseudonocardia abyssalis]MBW0133668.1 ABC transporter permease subunit [Pseudonocardia abyssalis]
MVWARMGRARTALSAVAAFALLVGVWELAKAVLPDAGVSIGDTRVLPRTDDAAMPHVWTVLTRLAEPEVAGAAAQRTVGEAVASGAVFTLGLALGGLVIGGLLGSALALAMARFGLFERALLPWVVLSQTVPLIAIAPLVAGWGGKIAIFGQPWQPWTSVMVISSYLAFFPIAVGMLRGLTSPRSADVELFRSLAAGWWTTLLRLRLPASVPHVLPAVRLAAAAAVVGAIVAEISTGTRGGVGRLIIEYAQSATGDPSRMYTAILGAAVLGLVAAAAVGLLDLGLRRYRGNTA